MLSPRLTVRRAMAVCALLCQQTWEMLHAACRSNWKIGLSSYGAVQRAGAERQGIALEADTVRGASCRDLVNGVRSEHGG